MCSGWFGTEVDIGSESRLEGRDGGANCTVCTRGVGGIPGRILVMI